MRTRVVMLALLAGCGDDRCLASEDCLPVLRGEGQPCTPTQSGTGNCRDGLRCNAALRFRCARPQGVGGPCQESGECEAPLLCNVQACAPAGTLGVGAGCTFEAACGPDLTCGRGRCLPALRAGDPCGDAPESCADGLACTHRVCR